MPKYKHLRGIVNDMASSFISACNLDFTRVIEKISKIDEGTGKKLKFKVDILNSRITPKKIQTRETEKTIEKYRMWLFTQMKAKGLSIDELKSVRIEFDISTSTKKTKVNHITLKPQESKMLSINWSAKSEIKIKDGRVFRGKSYSGWVFNRYSKKAMAEMLRSVPFKFTIEDVIRKTAKQK